jgi:hypothetical protein
MRVKTATSAMAAVAVFATGATGCSAPTVVNTGEPPVHTQVPLPAPAPSPSNAHLVDAFDYVAHVNGAAGYYFSTPSGKWRCAILPRVKAGCQSASSWPSGLGITDEPDNVNAIVVERDSEPRFVALELPEFLLDPGPANTLQFNKILAAAGFRCNVQESGVSCLSEKSGKGFTFSAEGYTPQYTDVPATAP